MGTSFYYLAPKQKLSFSPISWSDKNFNPQKYPMYSCYQNFDLP